MNVLKSANFSSDNPPAASGAAAAAAAAAGAAGSCASASSVSLSVAAAPASGPFFALFRSFSSNLCYYSLTFNVTLSQYSENKRWGSSCVTYVPY